LGLLASLLLFVLVVRVGHRALFDTCCL